MQPNALPGLSVMLSSVVPPAQALAVGVAADSAGVRQLWLTEDYHRKGGFSSAAAVLASTRSLRVGLGVVSAFVRHPAVTAMEIATIEAMFGGRFVPGLGLGVPRELDRMGVKPARVISALERATASIRALLHGAEVSAGDGEHILDAIVLEHVPEEVPAFWLAASGPQMISLAARAADGLLLSVLSSRGHIRSARQRIAAVSTDGGAEYPVTVFTYVSCDPDRELARLRARRFLAVRLQSSFTSPMVVQADSWPVLAPLSGLPPKELALALPDEVIDDLSLSGTEADCLERAGGFQAAGATQLALCPIPDETGGFDFGPVLDLVRAGQ